jgi:drug/metabolite transporter (DMT)-like permease
MKPVWSFCGSKPTCCISGSDLFLLGYISMLGSAASYGVFFLNAARGNLTALSSLTFSTPCFAAATGYLLFGETLTPTQLLGASITLGGVFFINYKQSE